VRGDGTWRVGLTGRASDDISTAFDFGLVLLSVFRSSTSFCEMANDGCWDAMNGAPHVSKAACAGVLSLLTTYRIRRRGVA
jgi:hypothetical protein